MPLSQVRNCNFGRLKADATGSSGVGYTILDPAGNVTTPRTTTGVYQTAPGIYSAYIEFPDDFRGQVLWDTGAAFPTTHYATEAYNVEENDPKVSSTYSLVNYLTGTVDLIGTELLVVSSSVDLLADSLTVVSGNVDLAVSSATQAAINSYGTYTKLIQVSGSVEAIKSTMPYITGTLDQIWQVSAGRWKITPENEMIFYKEDNTSEILRFKLFDDNGNPSSDAVFERLRTT